MGLFGDFFKNDFDRWLEKASYDDLSTAYEKERQQWASNGYNNGTGERSDKMRLLNDEMNRRDAEEWENNPNRDPNFHWTDANRWEKD